MPNSEPPGEVPAVNVSDSQGIQVGTGNTQYNAWVPKQQLDPVALSGLNPHVAVARLQQLPYDELVDFFARAKPGDVSEILGALLEVDVGKLAVVLADISRRKATELMEHTNLPKAYKVLPEASEAIAREAARLRWTGAGAMHVWDSLCRFAREYDDGHIFWSVESGFEITAGSIDKWLRERYVMFATGYQEYSLTSRSGENGIRQVFLGGTVYSSGLGTFLVRDDSCYDNEGASGGWLGFPTGEEAMNGSLGQMQRFEAGTVYTRTHYEENPARTESFAVEADMVRIMPSDRAVRPTSRAGTVNSSSGLFQTTQRFEIEEEWGTSETAVYWDGVNKPIVVDPQIWDYYSKLGAETSWLGVPIDPSKTSPRGGSVQQDFEQGAIYWLPDIGPHAVPNAVRDLIREDYTAEPRSSARGKHNDPGSPWL